MEWYPHHIEDYDADTLHLTPYEDGIYSRLIRWYYRNERTLPDDDVALAAIARIGVAEWAPIASRIRAFFVTRDKRVSNASGAPELVHKRCNAVIQAQNKKRRDGKTRQEKLRKNGVLDDVTRDKRVSNAPRGEESRSSIAATSSVLTEKEDSVTALSPTLPGIETPAAKPKREPKAPEPQGFAEWYLAFPLKKARPAAARAFAKAIKSGVTLEVLIAGAQRYAQEKKHDDRKFIAHPATWLNDERWKDEGAEQPRGSFKCPL